MLARRLASLASLAAAATFVALEVGCMNEVESRPPSLRAPVIQLTATSLRFDARTDLGSPAARTVVVSNAGGGTLAPPVATVTYGEGTGWLSTTVEATDPTFTLTVTASLGALTPGTYTATIDLTSAGASNSPRAIPVTFVVTDPRPAQMVLSTPILAFAGVVGAASPPAQQVTVTNGGDVALPRPTPTITTNTPWLSATVTGDAPPYTVTVSVDTAGLAASPPSPAPPYQGGVTLEAAGALPVLIVVDLVMSDPRTVTVTRLVTPWTEAGAGTPAPDPLIQAVDLSQDDGAGGLVTVAATPGGAGEWVATIGPGTYWATITWAGGSQTWVRASASALDLGADAAGRAGRAEATVATPATLDVTGLLEWSDVDDSLQLSSWDAQAFQAFGVADLQLPANSQELIGFPFDWLTGMKTLLVPADVTRVVQMRSRENQSLPGNANATFIQFSEAKTWAQVSGLTMADGDPVAIQPAAPMEFIQDVSGSLPLAWRKDQFEAELPTSADGSAAQHQVGVYAVRSPAVLGGAAIPLLEAFQPVWAQGWDPNCGTLRYGRFLPAAFAELVFSGYFDPVSRAAPGATTAAPGLQNSVTRYDAIGSPPATVAPLVGGPRNPTLDGASALAPLTGVSTTPTLSWDAPASGAPTSYHVDLYRLDASGAATVAVPVALFVQGSAATGLDVPAGVLQAGRTYVARLVARTSPGDESGASPFRVGVPFGEGVVWTATFATAAAP